MSNYTQATYFEPKDSLTAGDPLKVIYGADVDAEFAAISTAIATKVDTAGAGLSLASTTLAVSISGATALSAAPAAGDLLLIADISNANAIRKITFTEMADLLAGTVTSTGLSDSSGVLSVDINGATAEATVDGAADYVLMYDASAGALRKVLVDNLRDAPTVTAGVGLTGGGALTGDITIDFEFLGIEDLTDPGGDRIMFWDDSAGYVTWLAGSTGQVTISGTSIGLDYSGATELDGSGLDIGDLFLVYDTSNSAYRKVKYENINLLVASASTQTLALTDGSTLFHNNGASTYTVTVPPNSSVAFPIGTVIAFDNTSTGKQTLAEGSGVTITSLSDLLTVKAAGGFAVLIKLATDSWLLAGDLE